MESTRVDANQFIDLRERLRKFAKEREWDQFHSPKNLAAALVVESAELLEKFQWLTDDESKSLPKDKVALISQEMADVLLYLIRLADKMNIDLADTAIRKIELNAVKYPADKVRGSSRKYTEY